MTAGELDRRLHGERVAGRGRHRIKPRFRAAYGSLPDGVMFHTEQVSRVALLKWQGLAWIWSPEGYRLGGAPAAHREVWVLTPQSTCRTIEAGYVPMVHPSAHPARKEA